ncbi:MAG: Na+/H+ antiporter NhaA [Chloroflexota bacterium]
MPGRTRLLDPLREFLREEAAGGLVLVVAAIAALVLANSPWSEGWASLWSTDLGIEAGGAHWGMSLHHWVNDGLMVVFFLVVGLEIKRELVMGELREPRTAILPIVAAVGGAVLPAIIYLALNQGGPGASGWGVPMATDIAFALGVLALVGRGLPAGLRLFLATLAIVDDLIAVLVIALFYTSSVDLLGVAEVVVVMLLLVVANRRGVRSLVVYGVLGVALWLGVLVSGVHATVAGVLLAATIPAVVGAAPGDGRSTRSPLVRLEDLLHPWSAYLVVPLFALANAGVRLEGGLDSITGPIGLGIILGLLVGKPLGIVGATWLLVRTSVATLPEGVTWRQLVGLGVLAGIGFTMSLFIADLAALDEAGHRSAKLGVLAATIVTATVGWVVMRRLARRGVTAPAMPDHRMP